MRVSVMPREAVLAARPDGAAYAALPRCGALARGALAQAILATPAGLRAAALGRFVRQHPACAAAARIVASDWPLEWHCELLVQEALLLA
jgi:hypothetical protein